MDGDVVRYWRERRIGRLCEAVRMTRADLGRLPAETVMRLLIVHEASDEAMRDE